MTREQNRVIDMMAEIYIKAMGQEKWDSLTDIQKHDAVMALVKITLRAFEKMESIA